MSDQPNMKAMIAVLGCLLLFGVPAITGTDSLECNSCSNAVNIHECESTESCKEEQVCFKRLEFTNEVQFDMGCVDKERCGRYATGKNESGIVKMSSDKTSYCYECCSIDRCNKNLCEYPHHSLCKDDKSLDCAKLNSMFSICEITSEAKKICPRYCNLCDLVDGSWSVWSPWSSCDVTCGIGSILRHRSCTNPAPQNGGLDCPEKGSELKTCKLKLCPVHGGWSSWDIWGKCSATCGVGMRTRRRSCTNPRPQRFGDHCFGDNIDDELCNNGTCAVNGGWTDWSKWGHCSVSCGVGLQSRSRSCTNPTPDNGGLHCIGPNLKDQLCYKGLCAGIWTNWNDWSECCSVYGSSGVQTRNRTCLKNLFSSDCKGDLTEKKKCVIKETYTDCYEMKKNTCIRKNGVYSVTLWKSKLTIPVFCDFETDGGGWTVFQNRFNGNIDFYKSFIAYERGFGSVDSEFWLGLAYIYEMVSQGKTELRLDLTAADGTSVYETFQNFRLGKQPYYTLHIDKEIGTAGDGNEGLSYNNGMQFTAFDIDRDNYGGNCAVLDRGGWWYNSCAYANLNGEYVTPGTHRPGRSFAGMVYYLFKKTESLRSSRMMFRRV